MYKFDRKGGGGRGGGVVQKLYTRRTPLSFDKLMLNLNVLQFFFDFFPPLHLFLLIIKEGGGAVILSPFGYGFGWMGGGCDLIVFNLKKSFRLYL